MTTLRRELGLPGAVLTGLGSILGTGVFVSLALAAGIAGPSAVPAAVLAALVALCNGLSRRRADSALRAFIRPTFAGRGGRRMRRPYDVARGSDRERRRPAEGGASRALRSRARQFE